MVLFSMNIIDGSANFSLNFKNLAMDLPVLLVCWALLLAKARKVDGEIGALILSISSGISNPLIFNLKKDLSI